MSEPNAIKNDARREKRQQKLGPDACCVLCGESQWETLTPVRRSLLEAHHVVGRNNDADLTVPLCLNCHRKETEKLRQCGASMDRPQTLLDVVVAVLRGVGSFLVDVGEWMLRLAERIVRFIAGLDRECPQWRAIPEAAA